MGFTHYWYRKQELDADLFADYAQDVNRLLSNTSIPLTYMEAVQDEWREVNGFLATPDEINFNGRGKDSHETFYFPRILSNTGFTHRNIEIQGLAFGFTKTARKPYDVLVVACLILGILHFGKDSIKVSSDGHIQDWQKGLDLVNNTFRLNCCLSNDERGDIVVSNNTDTMPVVKNMEDFVDKINSY